MNLQDKVAIFNIINEQLDNSILEAQLTLQTTIEGRNNESKSTAGDKYETGRAMMQIEQQQNEIQLNKLNTLKAQLQQINITSVSKKIILGNIVKTNKGYFLLAIPFGKIAFKENEIHVISLASPLGQKMLHKQNGDTFSFLETHYLIESVL